MTWPLIAVLGFALLGVVSAWYRRRFLGERFDWKRARANALIGVPLLVFGLLAAVADNQTLVRVLALVGIVAVAFRLRQRRDRDSDEEKTS
jgi:uncharacterized membrane protein YfcA